MVAYFVGEFNFFNDAEMKMGLSGILCPGLFFGGMHGFNGQIFCVQL
jgi:hypothetical protein